MEAASEHGAVFLFEAIMREKLDGIIAALFLMAIVLIVGNMILEAEYRDLEARMELDRAIWQAAMEARG